MLAALSDTVIVGVLSLAAAAITSGMAFLGIWVTRSTRTQTERVDSTVAEFRALQKAYKDRGDLVEGLQADLDVERRRRESLEADIDAERVRRAELERHLARIERLHADLDEKCRKAIADLEERMTG